MDIDRFRKFAHLLWFDDLIEIWLQHYGQDKSCHDIR